jgi:hypothetical protein
MLRTGALVFVMAAGCTSADPYRCLTDADCTVDGVAGSCVPADDGFAYCAEGLRRLSGDECYVGARLDAADSACIADVCGEQPWCCAASWGATCVMAAEVACGAACGGRLVFAGERLTTSDHMKTLAPGSVDAWELAADGAGGVTGTAVATGIAGEYAYWRVKWADLDRDGAAELLVTTFDGYVGGDHQWLYAEDWTEVVDLSVVGSSMNVIDAGFGDYDRDGRVDVAMAGRSDIALMRGVATGDLLTPGPVLPEFPEVDPLTASVDGGDLDGDGDDDLVYLDYVHDLGRVIRSDAAGFALGPPFATASVVSQVRVGDVDGDRDLDVLVTDEAGALVLENVDGRGMLQEMWSYPPAPRMPGTFGRAIWVDVDGDGDLDVALGGGEPPGIVVLENVAGVLGTSPLWQSGEPQIADVEGLEAGDVDGDGDLDLAVAGGDDSPSRVWVNQGDRTFAIGWEDPDGGRRHRSVAMTRRPAP